MLNNPYRRFNQLTGEWVLFIPRKGRLVAEDRTRFTKPNAARMMACLNNLIPALLIAKKKYRYLPSARRYYYDAHPAEALSFIYSTLSMP